MNPVEELLRALDARWDGPRPAHLRVIGSGALLLQTDYRRGTKDADVLESTDLDEETRGRLIALAGNGTPLHARRRLYLDVVAAALPFLPQQPCWHALPALARELKHLEVRALDVTDVVVSKLKRFLPHDQGDVEAMIERGLVPHERLVDRFRSAVAGYLMDARAEDLPMYVQHLHQVERDTYGASPTHIELPSWIE